MLRSGKAKQTSTDFGGVAARAIDGGSQQIERVDMVVQAIGTALGKTSAEVDQTVAIVNDRLDANRRKAA